MSIYQATAWCDRTFTARFEVEAETPRAALAKAKEQVHDEYAEECDGGYPWDTFVIDSETDERLAAEEPTDAKCICGRIHFGPTKRCKLTRPRPQETDAIKASLRDILSRFKSCIAQGNGEIEGDREAIVNAERLLESNL